MVNNKFNRAYRFYFGNQDVFGDTENIYNLDYRTRYRLEEKIKPVFNPVKSSIDDIINFTLQTSIMHNINQDDNIAKALNSIWEKSKVQSLKYLILLDMILYKKSIIYIEKQEDNAILLKRLHPDTTALLFDELNNLYESSFPVKYITYENDQRKEQSKTLTVKKLENTYIQSTSDEIIDETIYNPIVYFECNYDISHMIDVVDDINEKKAWARNIYKMHGNPIINADMEGEIKLDPSVKQNNGYKILKGKGALKYLEMSGSVVQIMNNEVEIQKKELSSDYPVVNIENLLTGSNVSTETSEIRLSRLKAQINRLRSDFKTSFIILCKNALLATGNINYPENLDIIFEDIISIFSIDTEQKTSEIYVKYKELNNVTLFNEFRKRSKMPEFTEQQFNDFMNAI